jgi:DNA recombination protein RmuC
MRKRESMTKPFDLSPDKTCGWFVSFICSNPALKVLVDGSHFGALPGFRWKVAIVNNGLLLVTLRTVSYVWSLHMRQEGAEKIARQVGRMLDKFINFVDDLQKTRNAMRSCQRSVDAAWKKLSDGNANLIFRRRGFTLWELKVF